MGVFQKLMKRLAQYSTPGSGAGDRLERWQAMDSKSSAAPLGGEKTGKNPTERGKSGAKINLLVDERAAPLSVLC